jgi:biopolymer transport protein ExbD
MNVRNHLDQYLQLAVAPLAGIFLVLALCAFALQPQHAQGVWLELLQETKDADCGDGRTEVLHGNSDGSWWINEDPTEAGKVRGMVANLMKNRVERIVFFESDGRISIQEVAEVAANAQAAAPDLHIGLFTHRQEAAMRRTDHGITWVPINCMRWP